VSRAIADLHSFPGLIIHGDIHPVQWLRSKDGKLKLNDFNNAEILDWNRKEKSYCKADRGSWGGMVSPCFALVCAWRDAVA
jgi:serine/threonine protein kinase